MGKRNPETIEDIMRENVKTLLTSHVVVNKRNGQSSFIGRFLSGGQKKVLKTRAKPMEKDLAAKP